MVPLRIENPSSKFLNDIALSLPAGVVPADFVADGPFTISRAVLASDVQVFRISDISPRKVTTIYIHEPEGNHLEAIEVLNPSELGISVRDSKDRPLSPRKLIVIFALIAAAIYSAILGGFLKYSLAQLQPQLSELEKELIRQQKEAKKLRRENDKFRGLIAKQRLLLLARLRDYAKELEFWRNAMRTLIVCRGGTLETADALVEKITDQLGTLGTKSSAEAYETIRIAAAWTAEAETGTQPV